MFYLLNNPIIAMRKLFIHTVLLFISLSAVSQTNVIAHRGFWNTSGASKNSIAALVKADSINAYGSEFDVWLTKDGELIVNHDPIYKGRFIENTASKRLLKLKLDNGERMPSLRKYLETGKELNTRLVLELKKLKSSETETKAIEQIVAMVKELNLEARVEYISFSLHAVKEFIRLSPRGTPVYYLNGDLTPKELKEMGCAGPDYNAGVFRKHPEWIAECHELGLKVNVWTVNKEEDMKWFIDRKVDYITTDQPVLLQKLIQSQQ